MAMSNPESDPASGRQPGANRLRTSGAPYRGRFAPSPTGPLHFGSLIAAVGSYLAARHAGGEWLVRIDDLDPPREVAGSASRILHTLEAFGFEWNGPVVYQSQRQDAYQCAASQLRQQSLAYECTCSRTEIATASSNNLDDNEPRYPGWCRAIPLAPARDRAIRFLVPDGPVTFVDRLQGPVSCNVATESGDFVIRRRDGWFAYQLAAAVDDAEQAVTEVVRGIDLQASTCRQILLQRALTLPTPVYMHLPLAVDKSGEKLSKSAGAAALDDRYPGSSLWKALKFLQQQPPDELRPGPLSKGLPADLWSWAIQQWNSQPLRGRRASEIEP